MVTQQEQQGPTPASQWQGAIQVDGTDVLLPSGNVARCRQMAPTAFLTAGVIPDPLTGIVRDAIHTKKGLPPKKVEEIADDPEKLSSALEMFDRVLCHVIIEPPVKMPPACDVDTGDGECGEYANTDVHKTPTRTGHHQYNEGERDPNVLYADVVVMEDKMFLFQWAVGGTRDVQKFREEQSATMESLQNGQGVQRPAKRPARRK